MQKAQTLKGFRDFPPKEKSIRNFVAEKITNIFEKYGFLPLETPTLEYSNVLLGKYGDEADKLVYTFEDKGGRDVGLRYDQTVPLARFLGQYQHELPKFFRRYQLQNVFRAEKPQKGRFREFLQCDIDITGSTSPIADAEILACTYDVFKELGFKNIKLLINDRELLIKTLKPFETSTDVFSLIQSIDKLDKKSEEEVYTELVERGLSQDSAKQVLQSIKEVKLSSSLEQIIEAAVDLGVDKNALIFDPTLARGLDYYTGIIIEAKSDDYKVGSLAGGGRYDNLIKDLGGPEVAAVGLAFGFDRIIEAMTDLNLLSEDAYKSPILLSVLDDSSQSYAFSIANQLRENNINLEVVPIVDTPSKILKYADQYGANVIVLIGENEVRDNKITLKNLQSGDQQTLTIDQALNALQ